MDHQTHFLRTHPIRALERRLLRDHLRGSVSLTETELVTLQYGFAVARLGRIRHLGNDVDLFEGVAPFRHWLVEQLEYFCDPDKRGSSDFKGIKSLMPTIRERITLVRDYLIERHANDLPQQRIEAEITQRALVLVLGGGGGSGYTHLGTFATIAEIGLAPKMIVGSSMGALMGLYRSIQTDYDPMAVTLSLPKPSEFSRVFAPYRGYSKYGFPGAMELHIRDVGSEVFNTLLGVGIPRFDDLPIALRIIGTGLRTGIGIALSEVEAEITRAGSRFTPLRIRRRFGLFTQVMRTMIDKPRFLSEIIFGSDQHVRDFDALDAVGFSCAVPGFIHYDIWDSKRDSVGALQKVFTDRQLFRITDGGVISNVPARAAWTCVQNGEITTRNSFIFALDAFAPVANRNLPFYPVQQLVRQSTLTQRDYADYTVSYKSPPSPIELLKSFDSLQTTIGRVRAQLKPDRAYLSLAMRTLPAWPRFTANGG